MNNYIFNKIFQYIKINMQVLALFVILGCQSTHQQKYEVKKATTIAHDAIVGTWVAKLDNGQWKFVFEKGGKIKEIVRNDGLHINASQPRFSVESEEISYYAYYVCDPFSWIYNKKNNDITVNMKMDTHTVIGDSEVNCNVIDSFVGPINNTGLIWEANWTSITTCDDFERGKKTLVKKVYFEKESSHEY